MYRVSLWLGVGFLFMGLLALALAVWQPQTAPFANGALFFVLAGGLLLGWRRWYARRRARRSAWLRQHGRRVLADVAEVRRNSLVRFFWRCPWVIVCHISTPDGRFYRFESEELWFDPRPALQTRRQLPVLVDPNAPFRYLVLTEELRGGPPPGT